MKFIEANLADTVRFNGRACRVFSFNAGAAEQVLVYDGQDAAAFVIVSADDIDYSEKESLV